MKTIKTTIEIIKTTIKMTMKPTKRSAIIHVNHIFSHMLIKIFYIFLNAQNVTHIIVKNDNNENDDLKKKKNESITQK